MPGIQSIGCTILNPVYRASLSVALAIFRQRLIHRNAFQPIVDRPPRTMLPLISNVVFHPLQILRPEADHTVSALPLENFISGRVLVIDLVRRCSFQFSDEFADRNRGRNCHADVDERFNSTDLMHENTGGIDEPLSQRATVCSFNVWGEKRESVLRVPDEMEIDFAVVVSSHC